MVNHKLYIRSVTEHFQLSAKKVEHGDSEIGSYLEMLGSIRHFAQEFALL